MSRLNLDPRTKILLMILTVIAATTGPNLEYECILVLLIGIIGFMNKKYSYSVKGILGFLLLYLFTTVYLRDHAGTIYTMLIAWFSLIFQLYPCGMLAGIVISSTSISEFLAAMSKIHVSKKITIPLVIMMRYFPVIGEDWHFIKDAMRLRDVEPSFIGFFKNPALTLECVYVPLLMAASNTADELTVAAMTRGIENPKNRTSLCEVNIRILDVLIAILFLCFTVGGILWSR